MPAPSLPSSEPKRPFPHGIHGQCCNDNRCTCANKRTKKKTNPECNCQHGTDMHDLWKDSDVAGLQRGLLIPESCANSSSTHTHAHQQPRRVVHIGQMKEESRKDAEQRLPNGAYPFCGPSTTPVTLVKTHRHNLLNQHASVQRVQIHADIVQQIKLFLQNSQILLDLARPQPDKHQLSPMKLTHTTLGTLRCPRRLSSNPS